MGLAGLQAQAGGDCLGVLLLCGKPLRPQALGETGKVVRIVAQTPPSRRWGIERLLRERIAARFEERGVQVPTPPAVLRTGGDPAAR